MGTSANTAVATLTARHRPPWAVMTSNQASHSSRALVAPRRELAVLTWDGLSPAAL